jgi:protein-disulfide isomerase
MNIKRITFWSGFVIIIALIVWGLIVAMNKTPGSTSKIGVPAPVTSADHILGNVDAPVTLIEYGDFQCPACQTYYYYVEKLYNEASSSLRIVFRHFPLSQHPNAIPAAKVSEAAANQGKFWEMYAELYANQTDWSEKPVLESITIIESYGTKLGLDMVKFKADEASTTTLATIDEEQAEGVSIGIDHTPSFFLNGKEITPNNYDEFKTLIDEAVTSTTK